MILDRQKIQVIMILENFRSLIELLIFGTACLMLYLMSTLLIYLSLDLTIYRSGCSKMLNVITLPTLAVPEIDLSMTLKVIEKL